MHAQDFKLSLDYRIVEGAGSSSLDITVERTSSGPDTDVFWKTVNGSAVSPSDFLAVTSGSVNFKPGETSKTITVTIQGDDTPEPSAATTLPDEVFFVELTGVSGVGAIKDGRASVTIVDDDKPEPGVQWLSVVSDGTSTSGRIRLQWRVPAPAPQQIQIRWDKGTSTCTPPPSTTAGIGGTILAPNAAGTPQIFTHSVGTPHEFWCYSVFSLFPAQSAEIGMVKTRTFNSNGGPLKWAYTSSTFLPFVAPPTVGPDAIYAVDNDGVMHAMLRNGADAGGWPSTWNPLTLGRIAHYRSPVAPPWNLGWRLFVGTENGEVHSVDGRTGAIQWSRSPAFGGSQLMLGSAGQQAAPALLLKNYGAPNDLLLVGTATGANNTKFFALNPLTGGTIDDYPNGTTDTPPGPIENVHGMAVVDYLGSRVYFSTMDNTRTLWSLDLGNPPDALTLTSSSTLPWNPKPLGSGSGSMGSPVLRNGWLYLGTGSGGTYELHALRISDGTLHSYSHGDGQLKGFPWPDRRGNGRLYFSTPNKLHAAFDDGSTLAPDPGWVTNLGGSGTVTLTNPSIVLQRPGTDELYVGDGQGRLLRFNAANGQQMGVLALADATTTIGAPSLDNSGTGLLLVGSDKGVIYAVSPGF